MRKRPSPGPWLFKLTGRTAEIFFVEPSPNLLIDQVCVGVPLRVSPVVSAHHLRNAGPFKTNPLRRDPVLASVLIGSTDADFYLLLSHILKEAGFDVTLASSTQEIVHFSAELDPIAILLDCRQGEALAHEVCARLKKEAETLGIVTVALIGPGAEHLHLDLIKSGIDETFVRPMAPTKLIGFLNGLAGRKGSNYALSDGRSVLTVGTVTLDPRTHRVTRGGKDIHLGPIEFRLLRHLIENAGQIVSRQALIAAGWDEGRFVDTRTVNAHVGRLRRALDDGGPDRIRTVRSAGYMFDSG